MKMLSPKKSPRAIFCRQMKLKIANGDIGEAQHDSCYGEQGATDLISG
jgi:hypothetical protein